MRISKNDYFLGWISNLGVLPLFRSAAFLLAPILVFLRFLILRVCWVFEHITYLIFYDVLIEIKHRFISLNCTPVKIFIFLCCAAGAAFATPSETENTIVLAKGEQYQFPFNNIASFSLGNKQVLAHSFSKEEGLRIKGKAVGYSDLNLKFSTRKTQKFHVYIITKSKQLNLIQKSDLYQELGVKTQIKGDKLKLSGLIEDRADYIKIFQQIQHDHEIILNHLEVAPDLLKRLIAELYKELAELNYKMFKCEIVTSRIHCHLHADKHKNHDISFLQNKIPFIPHLKNSIHISDNFLIKIKLLLFENTQGEIISPGFDRILGSPLEIFNGNWKSFLSQNTTHFQKDNLKVSVLAEPQILTRINADASLSVGSDIPFTIPGVNRNQGLPQLSWQFAGLRVSLKIKEVAGKLCLSYKSQLTSPDNETISGNKEKGSVFFQTDQPFHLFQIAFRSITDKNSSLPWINQIPLLKSFFASSESKNTYKMINGYLEVSRR